MKRHFDRNQVLEAWRTVRTHNSSIPDDALDDMRDVLLAAIAPAADDKPIGYITAATVNTLRAGFDASEVDVSHNEAGDWNVRIYLDQDKP